MAKATVKTPAKKTSKTPARPKAKAEKVVPIEKVCTDALQKLQSLGIDQQLQADLEWCLGSYRHDKNPSGLFEMAERALKVFKIEQEKKTKGITPKLLLDIEKGLSTR